jgi:putative addiction module killer protein
MNERNSSRDKFLCSIKNVLTFCIQKNTLLVVYVLKETADYSKWVRKLRDLNARAAILKRVVRVGNGNLGDYKSVGGGVLELRIDYGPGYRVYFTMQGVELILLLIGGDKSSQKADIKFAQELKQEYGGVK